MRFSEQFSSYHYILCFLQIVQGRKGVTGFKPATLTSASEMYPPPPPPPPHHHRRRRRRQ